MTTVGDYRCRLCRAGDSRSTRSADRGRSRRQLDSAATQLHVRVPGDHPVRWSSQEQLPDQRIARLALLSTHTRHADTVNAPRDQSRHAVRGSPHACRRLHCAYFAATVENRWKPTPSGLYRPKSAENFLTANCGGRASHRATWHRTIPLFLFRPPI